ncbi:MAG TPA: 3-phosphoshikimate 1-carboxyvinyltransferase [Methanocorpusculum sp.]|nr:3-phosphoshikimate 1-carboxyvinyltransferase [Methanocorpusculum sp.]
MYTVYPSKISGTVRAPASKSETHREYVLSALARGTSVIRHPLVSADTEATLRGIAALGANVVRDGSDVIITGGFLHAADDVIDCGNSGTTLRFLTAAASRLSGTTRFTGDESLMKRPMQPLLDSLSASCGAVFSFEDGILSVTGSSREAVCAEICGDISSQFISALLIAGISVKLTSPLVSSSYADMTVHALEMRGVHVEKTLDGFIVDSKKDVLLPRTAEISEDWSSAAFLFAAGAVAGRVTVTGLDLNSTQGDKHILSLLQDFGTDVSYDGGITVRKSQLKASDADLSDNPDLFPVLAVIAAAASGTSRLYGVSHLIYKESNRLSAMSAILSEMGASIEVSSGYVTITGGNLHGASVSAEGDHRLFMAAAVAGLCAEDALSISDGDDVFAVSYPAFVQDIRHLGGDIR